MEPEACRAQLARLLADESSLLGVLAQQLQREHELLTLNDIEGLEQAGNARQASVAALLEIDDDRRALCLLLGRSADLAGLGALLQWCDPAGSLAQVYQQCAEQAQKCRDLNDRNGALVNARMQRVSGVLDMLAGDARGPRTYGDRAAGQNARPMAPGRLVSTSA
jgi:flagellar biosynthesis/type III secretory pathway chaperone